MREMGHNNYAPFSFICLFSSPFSSSQNKSFKVFPSALQIALHSLIVGLTLYDTRQFSGGFLPYPVITDTVSTASIQSE